MQILGTEKDKTGEEIDIIYSDRLAWTPAYKLVLMTHIELLEKNMTPPMLDKLNDSTKVIWAQNKENTIFGGIAFTVRQEQFISYIELSFTDPLYRRRGINTICFNYLEHYTKQQNLVGISSLVNVKNEMRLKSAEQSGFRPYGYYMWKKLV